MTSIVPYINDISNLRQRAEDQLDRIAYVEHATHLLPLAKRLQRHQALLDRHNLFVAFENDPSDRHPGLYLLKRNHSAAARIWICYNTFRLDTHAQSSWTSDVYISPYKIFSRDLSLDLDIAEQAIVTMLERDELVFGPGYMPSQLTTDFDGALRALPNFNRRVPAALPPPTIELKAVEVRPAGPVRPLALRPVALTHKLLPR